jgi:ring-1,2-phenylacetyl-CoA epoxidase subunit PaaE
VELKVSRIEKQTEDSVAIYLHDDNNIIRDFYPGQFITLLLQIGDQHLRRSYSIFTHPDQLPELGIVVKKVSQGVGSNFIVDHLTPGTILNVLDPYGTFTFNHKLKNIPTVVLFGAGSGITPLMSIAQAALKIDCDSKVILFYGNSNQDSIIFKTELEALQAQNPERFVVHHILSRPNIGWDKVASRITKSMAKELLKYENLIGDQTVNYYVCGPEGMLLDVKEALTELAIPKSQIHHESFYSAKKTVENKEEVANTEDATHFNVKITYQGEQYDIPVEKGGFILDAALDTGLDLPYACQSGICGMCRAFKVAGELDMQDQDALTDNDIAEGYRLTCCSTPTSTNLELDYDR